jgi:hypothetical protein
MTNHETSNDTQICNLTSVEMEQTHGGAWYAKFDGVDGSSYSRSSETERSSVAFVGGWGSSMYQYS